MSSTKKNFPIILAVDTSCDETSVAITQGAKILANIIASQVEIHRQFGGVMPLIAKLEHNKLINPSYYLALKTAKIKPQQIDAIAVTYGPGLAIALEVGLTFAKNLAHELKKPLIAINHMEGHLYSPFAKNSKQNPEFDLHGSNFPALALLVSGGHSDLVYLENFTSFQKIGQTIDDAAGECLDKFARLLDLGYPGAPVMEKMAEKGDKNRFSFPLPMTQSKDLNYSFSGLKTAGRHQINTLKKISQKDIYDLSASFQNAVFLALMYKLNKASIKYQPKSIWLGGGVSANKSIKFLVRQYCQKNNLKLYYPKSQKLSSDNAAMIGLAAYFHFQSQNFVSDFDQLQRVPRLSL